MLRESSLADATPLDLAAVTDPAVDPLVPGGRALVALVDATMRQDAEAAARARARVGDELGPDVLVDMAGVFAVMEMTNRIADATGIVIGRGRLASTAAVRAAAGLDRLRHD